MILTLWKLLVEVMSAHARGDIFLLENSATAAPASSHGVTNSWPRLRHL